MSDVWVVRSSGPNIIIRVLWFLFVGWWVGLIVSGIAWFLNCTIIGLPLGLWMINRLPSVMTLRPQGARWRFEDGALRQGQEQYPFLVRAVYFLLIGWWLSGLWMVAAYLATVSLIGLPLAFVMYGRVGAVTTLYRS